MTDLRPCPFCGSQRIDTGILTVGRCYCGTNGPAGYEGTTEGWNDRPLEDALTRQLAAANERAGRLEEALQDIIAERSKAEGNRSVFAIASNALSGRYPPVNDVTRKTLEL